MRTVFLKLEIHCWERKRGILAETPLIDRMVALAAGFMMFFAFKRTMVPGMIGAVSVFVVLAASRANGIF